MMTDTDSATGRQAEPCTNKRLVYMLLAVILIGQGASIILNRGGLWPFSNVPMYAALNPGVDWIDDRLVLVDQGVAVPLYRISGFENRVHRTLIHFIRHGDASMTEEARFAMVADHLDHQLPLRGVEISPNASVRLDRYTWPLRPFAASTETAPLVEDIYVR